MARFIIASDGLTAAQANKISTLASNKSWGYWHWIEDFWILNSVPDDFTAKALYLELKQNVEGIESPKSHMLVARLDPPFSYWGWAADDAWEWLKTNKGFGTAR